jgi:hypothetical protein
MQPPEIEPHAASTSGEVVLPLGYDPSVYDRGLAAFERDLPELIKTHYRQWVIYHGERRFGPSKSLEKLEAVCRRERIRLIDCVRRAIDVETPLEDIYF